jgi:hypothetical protein
VLTNNVVFNRGRIRAYLASVSKMTSPLGISFKISCLETFRRLNHQLPEAQRDAIKSLELAIHVDFIGSNATRATRAETAQAKGGIVSAQVGDMQRGVCHEL